MNRYWQFTLTFLLALSLLIPSQRVQADSTIVVNAASMKPAITLDGWLFVNEGSTSTGTYSFVDGPASHTGSLRLTTSVNSDGPYFMGVLNGFNIASLTTLTYDAYSSATSGRPSLQFDVDLDSTDGDTTSWQGRFVFVPTGPFPANTWQTFDARSDTAGTWYTTENNPSVVACTISGPGCTWSALITAFPEATVYSNWSQSTVSGSGAVGFKKGSGETAPFTGYIDNLVIDSTTYDFEPLRNVYVDDSWSAVSSGADPDSTGPATNYNADSFDTIQEGLDAVGNGGTVHVNAGIYSQDLTISKPLTLLGPNEAINPNTGTRVAEAIIHPSTSNPNPSVCTVMAYLETSDITIKGFTFDGDNPSLTSGILIDTADVDACEIIASYEGVGNINIEKNILKNSTYSGADFYNDINPAATSGNHIRYNLFEDIGETTYNWGIGVLVYNNFYADITDNVFNDVRVGIQTGNYWQPNPGSTGSISNNTISTWRTGIFHNLWYSNASTISITNNTINAISSPDSAKWNGILLSSFQTAVDTTISNNIINIGSITQNPATGYNVWNTPTTATLTISGGTVSGGTYGVWVNNFEGYASNASNTSIEVDGVTINNASTAGIFVSDSPSNTNSATVYANIQNSTISNSITGILVSGSDVTAKANLNKITGNTTKGINNTSGTMMDAEKNWWGNLDGPSSVGTGSGDSVSSNVDFTPWCGNAACSFFVPPFPLIVTANNQSKTVGQPDPTFTASYSGFVNGDDSADLDTAPVCGVSGPHSAAGVYTINCTGGLDTKYIFSSYVSGTLTVNAANNPPTNISLSNATINENKAIGSIVGSFTTTDPDAGNTFTYTFCGGADDSSFQISGDSLRSAIMFDYEARNSYSVCIRSMDNTSLSTTKVFTISINNLIDTASFQDVPTNAFGWAQIESIYAAGITGGCSITPLNYCPDDSVTRAQMAVFLLRGIHSSSYTPPPVNGSTGFGDVPVNHWAAAWIKQLAAEGITSGCSNGSYCPDASVSRAQMAIFLLKAKHGSAYNPPNTSGSFTDVPVGYWADKWIEQLATEGITGGCGTGIYCPENPVTRAQMAIFLQRTFNLPLP